MKEFISDLGVIPSASGPMTIFCDNTRAIALAKESRFHKRTKHIKRRFNSSAIKNILKYLKSTKDMFLVYGGDKELVVNGYIDASFDTDPDDSKSQTGYVFILNGGAVSWLSSKKSVMAGSTCEAEYIAASEAANEGVWMKEFISDLGVIPSASGPMKIFCDNT